MKDKDKTIALLNRELSEMRQRIAELEPLETQHKQAIEASQISEQIYIMLCNVGDSRGEGVAVIQDIEDGQGTIIFTNNTAAKLLGYSREELLQMKLGDFVPPATIRGLKRSYRGKQAGEKAGEHYETRILVKDGTEVLMQVEVSSTTYQGKPTIVGFIRDITERKQIEEALQRSKDHLQALCENAWDTVMVLDITGIIVYVSPPIERFFGYEPEELIGNSVFDFIHPDNLPHVIEVFNEGIQIPDYVTFLELQVQRKDGSWCTAECIGTNLMTHPSVGGIVINLRDITDRKQAEEALKRSKEYYQALIENSFDATIILNEDGSIRQINPSIERSFGWEPEDLIGETVFNLIHLDSLPYVIEAFNEGAQNPDYTKFLELKVRHKDGSWRITECIGTNLMTHPSVEGIVINLRDITDRKHVEEALQESEQRFRAIFDNAIDGICLADVETRQLYTGNEMFCQMLGYSLEEIGNLKVEDIHPEQDLPYVLEQFEKQLGGEITLAKDMPTKRKDGSVFYTDINSSLITLDQKTYLVGIFRDITERRNMEKKYRQLLDDMRDGYAVIQDNNVVFANIRLSEMFGYEQGQLQAPNMTEFIAPEDQQKVMELYMKVINGMEEPPERLELMGIKGDGTIFQIQVAANLIEYEGKPASSIIVRDITGLKEAEEALQRNSEYFQALIENTFDTIMVFDGDGIIGYVSPSIKRMLGYELEEWIGKDLFNLIHPDDLQDVISVHNKEIQNPDYIGFMQVRVLHKDGSWRIIEGVSTNLLDHPSVKSIIANFHDITERKEAEEALQQSKEYFQSLIENTFDTIMVLSGDGSIGYVSPSLKRTLGYEAEEWMGKNILSFIHPNNLPNLVNIFIEGITTPGYIGFLEMPVQHKDGSWRVIEGTGTNLLHNPSIAGIVASFHDITDYRQAEKRYNDLIEDINDGYIVYQNDKIVLANQRFADIFGYTLDLVLGQSLTKFMAPDTIADAVEVYKRAEDNKEDIRQYEMKARKGDGTEIIIDLSGKGIEHNGKQAYSVIFRDITERRHMEEKYRQLVEGINEGYAVIQDGNIVFANKRFDNIFGYKTGEIIGKPLPNFVAPENLQEMMKLYMSVVRGEEPSEAQYEGMGIKKDGTKIVVQASGKLTPYDGQPSYSIVARDITEQMKAKQELQELYEREIKLREALEEERRRRIEFTRVLVHELKTPLTPVLAASNLLADEVQDETLVRLSRSISKGALNLSNRIDDLLDIVKGEIGTLNLQFQSLDLLPLFHKVADSIAPMASSNGHSLILDLPQSLPLVWADENRLQQVILNLINNASKFTPDGGKITLRARRNGTTLIVEVQDTGKGISEEEQRRIFEPYYRKESDRQRLSGLGLGLALCKTIVELHKGQIWVESRLGEGSTFSFSLPLED